MHVLSRCYDKMEFGNCKYVSHLIKHNSINITVINNSCIVLNVDITLKIFMVICQKTKGKDGSAQSNYSQLLGFIQIITTEVCDIGVLKRMNDSKNIAYVVR